MSRVLGLDPGTKRCGVAVSNTQRTMAFPRPAFAVNEALLVRLAALVDEESIGLVIVGRPLALAGHETAGTLEANALYHSISERLHHVTVLQWDERLTTVEAQKSLASAGMRVREQRDHVDSAAAAVMLQNYLDGIRAL
ncbi:MAG TPA: Holliday junction resolvase RuvX [Acidimicrobiales bacterium]|jgi:putative Holliday junction resolvase